MIELYQFGPALGVPDFSPPCLRVWAYLHFRGLPFESHQVSNPSQAPKGKLPYIKDRGLVVYDSAFILDHLERNYTEDNPDARLAHPSRAQHLMAERMLMEHSYWILVHSRWASEENGQKMKEAAFGSLPGPLQRLVFAMVRRKILKAARAQGLACLESQDRIRKLDEDFRALATLLKGPYFSGEAPGRLDATVFAYTLNMVRAEVPASMAWFVQGHPELMAHLERCERFLGLPGDKGVADQGSEASQLHA